MGKQIFELIFFFFMTFWVNVAQVPELNWLKEKESK